jgi:adenylyl- and sulfurtransferase ThiI
LRFRGAVIVRWTGRGRLADLESSVTNVMALRKGKWRLTRSGASVLVEGGDPVGASRPLRQLPGVAWVAVGMTANSLRELGKASAVLAHRYLRQGDKFAVIADSSGPHALGDVAGAVASSALDAVKGARIDDMRPKLRIRATLDKSAGAVGVELSSGPGGVPTGSEEVVCLSSGGKHSSVLCWFALLSGLRVKLLHAETSGGGLRPVARLYAELSHRADPASISIEVLGGGDVASLLKRRLKSERRRVFGGFHSGCSQPPAFMKGDVISPLFLLPEEYFDREFQSLSLEDTLSKVEWKPGRARVAETRRFGGVRADVSQVLDGLR